jgi:hypothetical protein
LELAKEQEIEQKLRENAAKFVSVPVPPNIRRVITKDRETQQGKASQSLLSQLSLILGENESDDIENNGDSRQPVVDLSEGTLIRDCESGNMALSAHNLHLLEQQNHNRQQPRPSSESRIDRTESDLYFDEQTEIFSARGRNRKDRQLESDRNKEKELLLGLPAVAFRSMRNDSDDNNLTSSNVLDSLASPPCRKLPDMLKLNSPRTTPKRVDFQSPSLTNKLSKPSPKIWLENELHEKADEFSYLIDQGKQTAKTVQHDDENYDSDFSDLTDLGEDNIKVKRDLVHFEGNEKTGNQIATKQINKSPSSHNTTDRKPSKKKATYKKLPTIPIAPYQSISSGK